MTQYDPNSNDFPFGGPGGDLLSQIAAQDEANDSPQKKAKKPSFVINMFVELMRLTFYYDEIRRKNELTFLILGWVWAGLIFIVYLGGICALALMIYSYSQFPVYVRNFFRENNISVQNFEMPDYTFSRIELKNLQDKDKTYSIKSLIINSTFADFLQRRIKSVVLDGVTVHVSGDENGHIDFGMLPRFLVNLNMKKTAQSIKIDTLSITNAVLELDGYNMKIPVSFSFTGVYENNTKISAPFFVKQKEMDLMGTLSVNGNAKKMSFVLDITAGTLTLPYKSPENVTAKITVDTVSSKIDKVIGNLDFVYGRNTKKFKWNMSREKDLFRGTLDMSFVNVDVSEKDQEMKSNISLSFDGINFKHVGDFETQRPIRVTVQSFYQPNVSISRLFSTLNGRLSCRTDGCNYVLMRESPVSIEDMTFKYDSDTIRSVSETSFVLKPNAEEPLFVLMDNKVDYRALVDQLTFSGYRNSLVAPLSLNADRIVLKGYYPFIGSQSSASLDIERLNYSSIEQDLSDASLKIDNIFDKETPLTLNAKAVFKNNPFFGVPVQVNLENKGLETKAVFSLLDGKIHVSFDGSARLNTGEFSGNVYVSPIELKDIQLPLSKVSALFPEEVREASGQIAAIGRLTWSGTSQITGPFYVALKDVGFKRGNIDVEGMNGVLLFQTLSPVTTAANQRLFIEKVKGILPFENVDARFKTDSQFIRLASLTADMAGIPVSSGSTLLPYKTTNMIVYLKNNAIDLSLLNPFIRKTGLTVTGTGNVVLPLEFRNLKMSLKNAEMKMSEGSVVFAKESLFKPEFMEHSHKYQIKSGTFLINSAAEDDMALDVSVTTTGRLLPSGDKRNVHEMVSLKAPSLIDSPAPKAVPDEIIQRQKVVIP